MNLFKDKKIFTAVFILILIAALVYYFFFREPSPTNDVLTEVGSAEEDSIIGRDLLVLLAELKATHLDLSIFDSEAFGSLVDFGVIIDKQPKGRDNPFAPVGGASFATTTISAGGQ